MENNTFCRIVGIGRAKIKMFDRIVTTLDVVRHVPNLKRNLSS